MNIFVTDPDPKVAASHLDDKRVNKMIIETVQMLSVHLNGPYKRTHVNHPCTIWVGKNQTNLNWTIAYLIHLADEYYQRRGKIHLSFKKFADHKMVSPIASHLIRELSKSEIPEEFCNCTPYKGTDTFIAYQLLLNDKWDTDKRTPTWYGEISR